MAKQNKRDDKKKFRIEIVDAASHKPVWSRRFTKSSFAVLAAAIIVLGAVCVYALVAYTPLRTTIPGYPDANTKMMAIQNAIRMDSLENVITRWELYSENLRRVVEGGQPVSVDSIIRLSGTVRENSAEGEDLSGRDSVLRTLVALEEQFDLSRSERKLPIEDLHFFSPLKGVVSQPYDPALHPYVDITAPANSVVMSVLDGTVISAGWADEAGYTIQVQHEGDIITIYKHNQKLLKKTGDRVRAGAPIAIVGNTGSLSTGDHLHFELWYRGDAIDPAKYISF